MDELRQIREEITAQRLLIQSSNKMVADKLDQVLARLNKLDRRPGWRLYAATLATALAGWLLPWRP
jgi:hypothetical protein